MNLYSLAKKFPNEDMALLHLIKTRWPHGVRCIACDHDRCWLIEAKGKTGKPRKLFQCAECGLQFSATANTLFHDSHLPLTKWFAVLCLMVEGKKGISANQVRRHVPMSYKTAWYVCHRIREAMQEDPSFKVGGPATTVEMDEMYVGGRKRLHGVKAGKNAKAVVLGLAERDGQIHMQRVNRASLENIRETVNTKIDPETPKIVTDGNQLYKGAIPRAKHERGNHAEELKDKNWTRTQTVENAFSLFKRGIVGNYHKLSADHLDRYLGEFCWRYNRRKMQPWLFDMALTNMLNKKPLPYKDLTF
ncbi:IS1595 family transposase [Edaphobacter paludis]|uniref:IS1595 family transposase n=1 Tax=Edaphobacter paludis TaxID=3035702 RepID=A0AAU7DBX4_9BACT